MKHISVIVSPIIRSYYGMVYNNLREIVMIKQYCVAFIVCYC